MSIVRKVLAGLSVLGLLALLCIPVRAGPSNEKTQMTFSTAVEVPGLILPAGTYIFKLFDSQSVRNIVEIWNGSGSQLLATIYAVPVYRRTVTADTVVTFETRGPGAPPAVDTWFHPGDHYGVKFAYPQMTARDF